MTSGVQLGSTVDTRSRVSLHSLRQSIVRRLPPGVQVNLVVWRDDFHAHAWSFNGYTLIRGGRRFTRPSYLTVTCSVLFRLRSTGI